MRVIKHLLARQKRSHILAFVRSDTAFGTIMKQITFETRIVAVIQSPRSPLHDAELWQMGVHKISPIVHQDTSDFEELRPRHLMIFSATPPTPGHSQTHNRVWETEPSCAKWAQEDALLATAGPMDEDAPFVDWRVAGCSGDALTDVAALAAACTA